MKKQFQQINILFLALLAGQVLFASITWYLNLSGDNSGGDEALYTIGIPLLLLGAAAIAWNINRTLGKNASGLENLEKKIEDYRAMVIRRLSILEGANLMAVVAVLLTGNVSYLLYFVAGMLVFLFMRPRVQEFADAYGLKTEEKRELE